LLRLVIMRSRVSVVLAIVFAAACASSGNRSDSPPVTVQVTPLNERSDVYYFSGPIALQFQVAVANPTNETLTLRRLELQTFGSGAFVLRSSSPMNVTVKPKGTTTVTISVWGRALGGFLHSNEPVSLRTTAYFDGAHGAFVKISQEMLQPAG